MIGESSTLGIALFALVVAILALAVPFIVYIVTRPKLRLSVSNAEVRTVQETGTFTSVEIVAHNDGGRTALIEDWRVARYLGTDRQNLWRDITEDVPRRLGVQPHDWKQWRAECSAPVASTSPPRKPGPTSTSPSPTSPSSSWNLRRSRTTTSWECGDQRKAASEEVVVEAPRV
jgi:hypothetical protein